MFPVDLSNRGLNNKEKTKKAEEEKLKIKHIFANKSDKVKKCEPDLSQSLMKKRRLAANA